MTALLLPSYVKSPKGASEFYPKSPGVWWNGTCTWLALEACRAAIEGRAPSSAMMAAMAADGLARGYCTASNGATTLAKIAAYARDRLGYSARVLLQWNYAITNGNEELAGDWHGVIEAHAGKNAILMQVAHGGRLIDVETGIRDEAAPGLSYHAFAIVGKDADGYKVVDGDHPQAAQRLQTYAYDLRDAHGTPVNSLRAAVPVGLLVLAVPAAATLPKPTPAPPPPADPTAPYRARLAQIATIASQA